MESVQTLPSFTKPALYTCAAVGTILLIAGGVLMGLQGHLPPGINSITQYVGYVDLGFVALLALAAGGVGLFRLFSGVVGVRRTCTFSALIKRSDFPEYPEKLVAKEWEGRGEVLTMEDFQKNARAPVMRGEVLDSRGNTFRCLIFHVDFVGDEEQEQNHIKNFRISRSSHNICTSKLGPRPCVFVENEGVIEQVHVMKHLDPETKGHGTRDKSETYAIYPYFQCSWDETHVPPDQFSQFVSSLFNNQIAKISYTHEFFSNDVGGWRLATL